MGPGIRGFVHPKLMTMSNRAVSLQDDTSAPGIPASIPQPENKAFYPALDGLRAVAVLSVFFYHYATNRLFWWGWAGVDLFFVISGFLITGILYDTLNKRHYFRVFYTRRTLRIFPLYYAVWLVILLVTPIFHVVWNRWLIAWPLYLGNFAKISAVLHGQSNFFVMTRSNGVLHQGAVIGHFWSLCVEEQFYLVWPVVVFLTKSRTRLLRICVIGFFATFLLRCTLWFLFPAPLRGAGIIYALPFARTDSLLAGAWLALWLRGQPNSLAGLQSIVRGKLRFVGLGALLVYAASCAFVFVRYGIPTFDDARIQTYGFSLLAVVFVWVLAMALNPASPIYRLLLWRPLVRIGQISYGIYVLHLIPSLLFDRIQDRITSPILHHLGLPVFFAIVYLCAELSFRFFETPFLKLKSRLAPS